MKIGKKAFSNKHALLFYCSKQAKRSSSRTATASTLEDSHLEAALETMELPAGTERWWWPHLPQCVKGEPRWKKTETELNLHNQGKRYITADERNE